jgi:hypothetical protein
MTRGRRVPSAPPENRRQRGANIDRSPAHLEGVQAFMRDVDATAREHADTRGAVVVTIGEPVHIAYVPAERLAEMVPPELALNVRAYDMAKEYVVIAVDRSKQPPLEYRIVKRGA